MNGVVISEDEGGGEGGEGRTEEEEEEEGEWQKTKWITRRVLYKENPCLEHGNPTSTWSATIDFRGQVLTAIKGCKCDK